jgi:ABC-type polysaccharide/polyol phosphate export permease
VESINTILFWLVPIFYGFESIDPRLSIIYQVNPVAALVFCMRNILWQATAPRLETMRNLAVVSIATFVVGLIVFQRGKHAFYEHI